MAINIKRPSSDSPKTKYKADANTSIKNIGSLQVFHTAFKKPPCLTGPKTFFPNFFRRIRTSDCFNPENNTWSGGCAGICDLCMSNKNRLCSYFYQGFSCCFFKYNGHCASAKRAHNNKNIFFLKDRIKENLPYRSLFYLMLKMCVVIPNP